jgi:hypothetical protein
MIVLNGQHSDVHAGETVVAVLARLGLEAHAVSRWLSTARSCRAMRGRASLWVRMRVWRC